jgi:hypothetical protein
MPNSKAIGVAYSDQSIDGGSVDNSPIGAVTPSSVVGTTIYASTEIGYTAGAQGAVTQATSKSTGVTSNTSAGQITMNAASLPATTNVTFTLTNNTISAKDVLLLNVTNGTSASYNAFVSSMTAGSATITLRNISASPLAEAVVINYAIIHCA